MAACRCSRRSSEACRRAMTPPMPPAPLARMPVLGSIVVRSNGRTKAPLSRDAFAGVARGSPAQLPRAGGLSAPLGDAILVGESNLRLACDQPGEYVFAEGEIGGGADGPHRHDHQRADHDPEGDRPDAHVAAGMNEAQARLPRITRPAGIIAMVVL